MNLFQKMRLTILVFNDSLTKKNVIKNLECCFYNIVKSQPIILSK